MKEIVLKNGTRELEPAVKVIMFAIRELLKRQPLVFYDLAMRCRDRNYKMWDASESDLKNLSLLQFDGQPPGTTRNIILSAVEGDGADMHIVNPSVDDNPPSTSATKEHDDE